MSDDINSKSEKAEPLIYQIRIKGHLDRKQGCCKIILAACGGSQKEKKRFFRGHPEPQSRACRP
jgi:hypothetical protein